MSEFQANERKGPLIDRPPEQRLPRWPHGFPAEALLEHTVSVPWERSVHAARLRLLARLAYPGERSVHLACGTDRLGFIDLACGLTTVLTDINASSLEILSQQLAELEQRLGPVPGVAHFRLMPVEALASPEGFPAASIQHFTLQNLFNTQLHPPQAYPAIMDALLTLITDRGTLFLTESEAAVLETRARVHGVPLLWLGRAPGYYDEDVIMLQVCKSPTHAPNKPSPFPFPSPSPIMRSH